MNDKPWWATVLQWTLWAVAMSLIMGWLGRTRLKSRPPAQASTLSHPVSTLLIGSLCFLLFISLAIISNVIPNKTSTWWTTAIFVGFAAMSAPLILDFFIARHHVSSEGLAYTKLTGAQRYLRWADLLHVRYSPTMKWFVLKSSTGDVARISVMLMGLPVFARELLQSAPAAAIDPATTHILRETAEGRPPTLWN